MSIYLIFISAAIAASVLDILGSAIYKIGKLDGYSKACDDMLRDMERLEDMTKVEITETTPEAADPEEAWLTIK